MELVPAGEAGAGRIGVEQLGQVVDGTEDPAAEQIHLSSDEEPVPPAGHFKGDRYCQHAERPRQQRRGAERHGDHRAGGGESEVRHHHRGHASGHDGVSLCAEVFCQGHDDRRSQRIRENFWEKKTPGRRLGYRGSSFGERKTTSSFLELVEAGADSRT